MSPKPTEGFPWAFRGNHGARNRGAFTMVEVLVTLAFASILLPTVMQGISLCLSTAGLARQEAQAAALAHGKLSELVATGQYQAGSLSGDFEGWSEFRWEAQITSWDSIALDQLEVTVSWKHSGKERSVSMATLVYLYAGNGSPYTGSGALTPGGLTPAGGTP